MTVAEFEKHLKESINTESLTESDDDANVESNDDEIIVDPA
jgi:hypothetical protein